MVVPCYSWADCGCEPTQLNGDGPYAYDVPSPCTLLNCVSISFADIGVESPETVQQLRDRMHDSLLEYTRTRGPSSASVFASQRRVGNLLLALPILMQVKILAKEYWFNVKKGGRVPLHKLLSEMLEYACAS